MIFIYLLFFFIMATIVTVISGFVPIAVNDDANSTTIIDSIIFK